MPEPKRFGLASRSLLSKRAAVWIVCALLLVLCIYRIATFIPQPLDGPHTLRPILNNWLSGFERMYESPEKAYETWRMFCLLALLLPAALATLNFAREHGISKLPDRVAKILCSRTLLFTTIAAVLLLCRYPFLVDYQLNPDEGQFLTAAHKLFYDGSFFHSVDCGTSGPLNIYPLMLPAMFGISPDFASSRILVIIVAWCIVFLLYLSVRLLAPDSIARIAVLPVAGALTVFEHTNLVHYSSEQIPVLLVSAALYTATRVLRNPVAHRGLLFMLGLLTSAAFFSKMQGLPIVFSVAVVSIAYIHATHNAGRFWRPALFFLSGVFSLLLLNAVACLADGVWTNFWMSYIVSNQRYADVGTNFITELPSVLNHLMEVPEVGYFLISFLAIAAAFVIERSRTNSSTEQRNLLQMAAVSAVPVVLVMAFLLHSDVWATTSYVGLIAMFAVPMYFLLFYDKSHFGTDPLRWFGLLSAVSSAAAVFSVYRPHRLFPHYMLFLFPPLAAAMAWMLMRQNKSSEGVDRTDAPVRSAALGRLSFPLIFVVLALAHATYLWGSRDPHGFRTMVATIRAPEGDFIRSLTDSDGQIFVWGWTADPYLSSGRVSPVRDYNMTYLFEPHQDLRSYYLARLMHDLGQNPPELFIDSMGPASWVHYSDASRFNFEQFPEIAQFVTSFYVHIADAYGQRFYLRRDLMPRADSVKPRVCAPAAVRCADSARRVYVEGATTMVFDNLPAVEMPAHALIEADFTPMGRQTENATIFNNEAVPGSFRGLRFENAGGDEYRLLLGLGDRWVLSNPLLLPPGKPVSLTIEFIGTEVHIRTNGGGADDMHLTSPVANTTGPITVGSWIGGQCRFAGTIRFFQIVDLEKTQRPGA